MTVVVTTHDRPDLLSRAVASVAQQSLASLELLVVCDSPRDLEGARRDYCGSTTRVLGTRQRGPTGSRNLGYKMARGELVAFLDDDDWWDADFLLVAVEALRASSAGFVVGHQRQIRNGVVVNHIRPEELRVTEALLRNPGFGGSNVLYRRAVLDAVGGFDEVLTCSEDRDLLIRLLRASIPFVIATDATVFVDREPRNRLSADGKAQYRGKAAFYSKHKIQMSTMTRCRALLQVLAYRRYVRSGKVARLVSAGARTLSDFDDLVVRYTRELR